MEMVRAEKHIHLVEMQIQLTMLQQRETKMRICLLKHKKAEHGIVLSDEVF